MHIVVVDDEPALLESLRAYLTRLGHVVTGFHNAQSAWDYFVSDPTACTVTIVDLSLEAMSGEELIRKMLQHKPDAAVIATSGYHPALYDLRGLRAPRLSTLEKPFTPQMLIEALERLISNQKAAPG